MVAVIIGDLNSVTPQIEEILGQYNLRLDSFDTLVIKEDEKHSLKLAKKIRDFFAMRPQTGISRAVIVESDEITVLEQNALLKTAEELPSEYLLIFISKSEGVFLPTLLSRCKIYKNTFASANNFSEIEEFIKKSELEQFEVIEKIKSKDEFLINLIGYYAQKLPDSDPAQMKSIGSFLEKTLEAFNWSKHNVNMRGILEYLTISLPPTSAQELKQKYSA